VPKSAREDWIHIGKIGLSAKKQRRIAYNETEFIKISNYNFLKTLAVLICVLFIIYFRNFFVMLKMIMIC